MRAPSVPPRTASTKVLTGLGVGVSLGFAAIFLISVWQSAERDREQARSNAANILASLQQDIARTIETFDLSLLGVADGLALAQLERIDPEVRQIALFDRATRARHLGAIMVLDSSGVSVADSRSAFPPPIDYSETENFQYHLFNSSADRYLSRPWTTPEGESVIGISRRVEHPDGSFKGIVLGTIKLSYPLRLFSQIKLHQGDSITLIRSDGVLLTRTPFDPELVGRDLSSSQVYRDVVLSKQPDLDATSLIDGVKRMFVVSPVGSEPLFLVSGISHDSIYSGWRQTTAVMGSIVVALCAITIMLVFSITRALKRSKRAEEKLARLAKLDGLTGLSNRRHFDETLVSAWHNARAARAAISLLLIDADHFKSFNDTYGHQAGDAVLRAIGACIRDCAQGENYCSARFGGEEFAVLLPGVNSDEAFGIAEMIRSGVNALEFAQSHTTNSTISVSIGVATSRPDGKIRPRELIRAADAALYEAKALGRNVTLIATLNNMAPKRAA